MRIDWATPYDGGSTITEYIVMIQQSNGVLFSEDLTNCLGTDATVLSNTECLIPYDTLLAEPYSLAYGDSVYAKVKARNALGDSDYSSVENGAVILTGPDPPTDLADNTFITNKD